MSNTIIKKAEPERDAAVRDLKLCALCHFNAEHTAHESFARMLESLQRGTIKRHVLTGNSISFALKQEEYLAGYARLLKSRNYNYILMCEGIEIL